MVTLKELRKTKNWSRSELARRASMSASTVGQIESGRLTPYPVQLEKLAEALGVSAADIAEPASIGA